MESTKRPLAVLAMALALGACSASSGTTPMPAALEIQPPAADVAPGDSVCFAAFDGGTQASVTWTVQEPDGGVVDGDGNYTAPAAEGTYHVVASAPNGDARAAVVVRQRPASAITVTIRPKAASVTVGATLAFSASVTGTADSATTWSIDEGAAGGTVSEAGLYTAPQTAGTYHVVARSTADPSQLDRATVTVIPAVIPPAGPQLYVSTGGDDANPGTEAQPWRTIQKAMSSATPGTTVNIRGGTYHERLTMNVQGTPGSYITFQPYGFAGAPSCGGYTGVECAGEKVILDYAFLGTANHAVPNLRISNKSYVRIQGLTFRNFTCDGPMQEMLRIDGSSAYVEIKHNRILDMRNVTGAAGVHTTALSPIRFFGPANHITIYGNELGNLVITDGEAITVYNSPDAVVENNWLHDIDAIGIDVAHGGSTNDVVRGNRLEYVAKKRDGSLYYSGAYSAGIYFSGASYGLMERNSCSYCANAIQIISEPGYPPTHDIAVRNNVVASSATGIVLGTWYSSTDGSSVHDVTVRNNTFYGNSAGITIRPMTSASVSWKNNAFVGNGTSYVNTLGWNPGIADYNLYSGGGSGPDAHPMLANPRFTNPGAFDFSLGAGSPAIDAGDPGASASDAGTSDFAGGARIVGGRVDMGAHEKQ
jgi:nitrous oxidase accessory protein NosD